jgi:autotransporter passenger strand-loop-strand repeat protein
MAGGSAVSTTVSGGGVENVEGGGTTISTTMDSGGTQFVSGGGHTSFTTVSKGDAEIVLNYSLAVSSTGGAELVYSGGTASVTTVDTGGSAVSTIVNDSGFEVVSDGGTASFTTVNNGGEEVMFAGSATSTTVNLGGPIDFTQFGGETGGTAFVGANDVLSVTVDGITATQQLAGTYYASENFVLSVAPIYAGAQVTLEGTPCYCRGTPILTDRGEIAVEDLHIGDRVVRLSGAARPIRWIGRRSYAGRFAAGNRNVLPIMIRRSALFDGTPRRDLYVSPLHAMFLEGVLVPASALVNGASIVQLEAVEQVEYFYIELDTHDVILAEAAPSETFADDDSRGMFYNAAEYRLLYPDRPRALVRFCAPRVEDGAALEAVRLRLAARAQALLAGTGMTAGDSTACGTLQGRLDQVGRSRIAGWARDMAAPDRPVRLRIVYSVADLHHVRLERQAAVEARPELLAVSRRARLEECVAAWSADAVITHSADEVDLLRRLVPEASVYRVPWQVPQRATSVPFAMRGGVAFVGSYAHAPNVDAACWLVEAVMPLV